MACKCYHAERNFLGKIGVCWGTKECEPCSCGGDESKCDFYEDKRKKATPKTNADHIRGMTDKELMRFFQDLCCPFSIDKGWKGPCVIETKGCAKCWLEWLRKEKDD